MSSLTIIMISCVDNFMQVFITITSYLQQWRRQTSFFSQHIVRAVLPSTRAKAVMVNTAVPMLFPYPSLPLPSILFHNESLSH